MKTTFINKRKHDKKLVYQLKKLINLLVKTIKILYKNITQRGNLNINGYIFIYDL